MPPKRVKEHCAGHECISREQGEQVGQEGRKDSLFQYAQQPGGCGWIPSLVCLTCPDQAVETFALASPDCTRSGSGRRKSTRLLSKEQFAPVQHAESVSKPHLPDCLPADGFPGLA